jgi:hypothetical protein
MNIRRDIQEFLLVVVVVDPIPHRHHTTSLPFTISAHRKSQHVYTVAEQHAVQKYFSRASRDSNEIEFAKQSTCSESLCTALPGHCRRRPVPSPRTLVHNNTCARVVYTLHTRSWMNRPDFYIKYNHPDDYTDYTEYIHWEQFSQWMYSEEKLKKKT